MYISEYTELPLREKEKRFFSEFVELIAMTKKFCDDYHIETEMLFNRELVDVNKENYSHDDFVEAAYVYLQSFKELYGEFFTRYVEDNYE